MTIKTQDNKASKLGAKLLAAGKHDKDKKKKRRESAWADKCN